jgi:hypothetical protein
LVFKDITAGLAIPLWTIDETADQPPPWRYPERGASLAAEGRRAQLKRSH